MDSVGATLAKCSQWDEPRTIAGNPFHLACRLEPAATEDEIRDAWPDKILPAEVRDLWATSRRAELFVDVDYGQWGLRLLSPVGSAARSQQEQRARPADMDPEDVVIGEFLGDQDLVVVDADGAVLIALPLDQRADWYRVARDLAAFLDRYVATSGEKYWEPKS
jgi:hypothetical protein